MIWSADEEKIVLDILRELIPTARVEIFGSRATGTTKPFSDLDLLISDKQPLSIRQLRLLHDAFSDSDLPYRVDVVDALSADKDFVLRIQSNSVVIQQGDEKIA